MGTNELDRKFGSNGEPLPVIRIDGRNRFVDFPGGASFKIVSRPGMGSGYWDKDDRGKRVWRRVPATTSKTEIKIIPGTTHAAKSAPDD